MSAPADLFLSYAREDAETAGRFARGFEAAGFTVWWDAALRSGEAYDQVTEKALKDAKAVVVLWSRTSVESRWVRAEATLADRNKTLVPAMIEACERPIMFELTHTADLSRWDGGADDAAWQAFVADVRRFLGSSAEPGRTVEKTAVAATVSHGRDIRRWAAIGVAAAAIVAFGAWFVLRGGTGRMAATSAPAASAATPTEAGSIAVVPFANLTGEPDKEYFSDGMAEELINVLAKVPGLDVASRTSSFAYKGKNSDIRQIARDLGVKTILEGSVRSAGTRVRITAQLINAESGYHLWSETYDRDYEDLFRLQDELAHQIVAAYKKTMGVDLPEFESQGPPTQDLEAYAQFLKAQTLASSQTDAGFVQAAQMLDAALERDPKFARAAALRATFRLANPTTPLEQVEREARFALSLEADARVDMLLAQIEAARGNWLAAEDRIGRLKGDSNDPGLHNDHVIATLWSTGRMREAIAELNEARRLGPAVTAFTTNLARANSGIGQDAEARRYMLLAIEQGADPTSRRVRGVLVEAEARAGRYAEAAEQALTLLPAGWQSGAKADAVRGAFAAVEDVSRRRAAANALRAQLASLPPEDWVTKVSAMTWFARIEALDDVYAITEDLRRQFRVRNPVNAWSWLWTPELRAFRRDPRFTTFATRVGMMDYWRKYGPPDDCTLDAGKLVCR